MMKADFDTKWDDRERHLGQQNKFQDECRHFQSARPLSSFTNFNDHGGSDLDAAKYQT